MNTTPPSLLHQLRSAPDARCWSEFIDLYTPLLYRWANRAGLREHDAADLVQEVFVVLVKKLPEFDYDSRSSFRAWLKAVLMNLWRNQVRQANRAETARPKIARPVEQAAEPDLGELEYLELLSHRALELMRADFGETTWRACWMLAVEKRPTAEVARELGLTENAATVAKFRVLTRLRQKLQGLAE